MRRIILPVIALIAVVLTACDAFKNDYPPYCTILFPANAEEFDYEAPVKVFVKVSDVSGVLSHVNIYVNTTLKASFDTGPYEVTLTGEDLPVGSHIIQAEAVDKNGGSNKNYITILVTDNYITVAGGSFTQGRYPEPGTGTLLDRTVHLSPFRISRYEITNEQFCRFLNDAGCGYDATFNGKVMIWYHQLTKSETYPVTDKITFSDGRFKPQNGYEKTPVTAVTWHGANEYCKFYGGTLPTAAQWMFAAQGGNLTQGFIYSGGNVIEEVSWYSGNATEPKRTGQKKENELGLYDMTGNVSEWLFDFYGTYTEPVATDPLQPDVYDGNTHFIAGGSYANGPDFMPLSTHPRENRAPEVPSLRDGFRIVKPADR
ncbi:MAG: formylglycine-generating enzyme family protein [Bacteroidetes bacterium]|nr:formylglycine-generating enzyme family protein [Bacteroidota bacterium]